MSFCPTPLFRQLRAAAAEQDEAHAAEDEVYAEHDAYHRRACQHVVPHHEGEDYAERAREQYPERAADFTDAEIFDDLRHAVDEEVRREQHTQRHDARERMREEYDARRDGYDRHEGLLPRAVARAHRAEGTEGAAEADREQQAADHRLDGERREQRHRKRDEAEREHNRADDVESSLTFHEIFF